MACQAHLERKEVTAGEGGVGAAARDKCRLNEAFIVAPADHVRDVLWSDLFPTQFSPSEHSQARRLWQYESPVQKIVSIFICILSF